jgi:spartin
MQISEQNQAEFWTTMAPNVDDYGSSVAKGIATGSGQIIKGIFWVRDSTVAQLDNGSIYMQSKLKANDKEHKVSPRVLRNLHRVRRMSRATDNVAKALLTGVLVTTGFFEGAIIKSKAGKKIFKLMPGEVALVSLDAFGKLFDAVDKTGRDVLQSTSLMTQNVVSHRFGEPAARVAEETLATTGHVVSTAWTVIRLRKAFNPKDGAGGAATVTKTGMLKNVARNKIMGGKK